LVEELRRGGIDVALVSAVDDPAGVETTELAVEELYLMGTTKRLRREAATELADLSDASFVDFPSGWGVRTVVDHAFTTAGVDRRVTIEVADVSAFIGLLQAGLGIALAPRSLLPRDHGLQTRRLARPISWRVVMGLPANRPLRAAAGAFSELVLDASGTRG
jgi:DNA-binding transcriptional LysR family regulator